MKISRMCNTPINRLHDRRLYIIAYIVAIILGVVFNQALILIMAATVTAVVFMPTRRLGLMGRLFITLSVYISINTLLAFVPWVLKVPMSIWLFAWTVGVFNLRSCCILSFRSSQQMVSIKRDY